MQLSLKSTIWKVLVPVAIGAGVSLWLFRSEFRPGILTDINFDARAIAGILLALLFVVGRDFGLTWRFHTIAHPDLSWRRSLRVDLMCAFTSAITPSAVGGSALAIFFLNREGLNVGRATTLTLTTLFLDELFFVVFCPVILLLLPMADLFGASAHDAAFMKGVQITFWIVYGGIVAWTAILFTGIILKPSWVKSVMLRLFSLPFLRRWLPSIEQAMCNMEATSQWVKQCSMRWWLQVFFATVVSWFSRYLIVNALFWGFVPGVSMLLVFARQFVVWVVLMVSPTPGGSGVSEWMFTEYYGDLIGLPALALTIALVWRLITYYIYLVIGCVLVPGYLTGNKNNRDGSDDEDNQSTTVKNQS